jgi:Zn-finger protein
MDSTYGTAQTDGQYNGTAQTDGQYIWHCSDRWTVHMALLRQLDSTMALLRQMDSTYGTAQTAGQYNGTAQTAGQYIWHCSDRWTVHMALLRQLDSTYGTVKWLAVALHCKNFPALTKSEVYLSCAQSLPLVYNLTQSKTTSDYFTGGCMQNKEKGQ